MRWGRGGDAGEGLEEAARVEGCWRGFLSDMNVSMLECMGLRFFLRFAS